MHICTGIRYVSSSLLLLLTILFLTFCFFFQAYPDFPNHKEEGWTASPGGREVRRVLEKLSPLIKGVPSDGRRQIFIKKPATWWDNYFSGDRIVDYCGENGWPMASTVQRGRLPSGVPSKYFHKKVVAPNDQRAKVARFFNPVVAVKSKGAGDNKYTKVILFFVYFLLLVCVIVLTSVFSNRCTLHFKVQVQQTYKASIFLMR